MKDASILVAQHRFEHPTYGGLARNWGNCAACCQPVFSSWLLAAGWLQSAGKDSIVGQSIVLGATDIPDNIVKNGF